MSRGGPPALEAASLSDVGLVRERNEDACGDGPAAGGHLFVVADGMGGHAGGQTASRLAVETVRRRFESAGGTPGQRLREALQAANREILEAAQRDARLAGMGTTGVALWIGAGEAWVANVGDSRAYRLREGELEQLTRDHSLVEEMVRLGVLTSAQARVHPRRNEVLRALGTVPEVEVDVDPLDLRPGDVFLLCSDGLCGVVGGRAIAARLGAAPAEAVRSLVEAALDQGAPDNVTVQVVRIAGIGG